MATAYLAPALVKLRNEVNAAHPKRDKSSDGWIGDTAHAARVSDHNPDPKTGVVRALDLDKDGMYRAELRNVVLHDSRTEYFIQDGLIYERSNGFKPRKYTGSNPHTGHGHTSIRRGKTYENSTKPWGYTGKAAGKPAPKPAPKPATGRKTTAQLASEVLAGTWGNNPSRSDRLRAAGYNAAAVQAEVNRRLGRGAPTSHRLSVNQLAQQVIAGDWGNGTDRQRRLQQAGYNYREVQNEVNRLV